MDYLYAQGSQDKHKLKKEVDVVRRRITSYTQVVPLQIKLHQLR